MASIINASTSGAGGVITTADASGLLNIQTAATTALSVTAAQDVYIGATDTSGLGGQLDRLRIVGTTGPNSSVSLFRYSGSLPPNLRFYTSGGSTVGSLTAIVNTATMHSIQSFASDGTSWLETSKIRSYVTGTVSTGIIPTTMDFSLRSPSGNLDVQAVITQAGDFAFNSGYGSAAVAYGCRAWVNFNGTAASNLTGTYSQTGTTVTVTITGHGYVTGNSAYLDFTSGTAVDGAYEVTVTDANTFTVTQASRTTSGNVTDRRNTIRASGNVSSIADNATGYFTVNFINAMPDINYSISANCSGSYGSRYAAGVSLHTVPSTVLEIAPTVYQFRILTPDTSAVLFDPKYVNISVFR